jgi:hypothetical protein
VIKKKRRKGGVDMKTFDLSTETLTELPSRKAMSLVNANIAAPICAALALNVASDGSVAYATATQYAPITQGI